MKQKYLLLSMILFVFLVSITSLSVFAVTPNLELTPSTQSLNVGSQANINVMVENVTDLRGANITLNFDASKLQYISSANGGFIPSAFLPAPTVDNVNGSIILDIAGMGASAYASGSGTIMTVVFERIATGNTDITFGSTTLRDKDNITITHTKGNGCLITSLIGDFYPDNCVDFEDLMIFAMAYGSCTGDDNWIIICDIYPDGCIDFEDLMIFAMHYGECECILPSPPTLSDPGSSLPSPANYTVSWSSVSEATYILQEATSPDFSGAISYPLPGTSKEFSHIVSTTTTYYYRVAAIDSCGQSSWSNVEDIQICPDIIPPTVTTLPADSITTTSARLLGSIDATGGEDPFAVVFEYRLKSEGLETFVKYGVGTYYANVTGLTHGTTNEFRFYAENSAGKGYGEWLEFTTDSENAKWTVMVYMDGDNNLEWCYWDNLSKMESVGSTEEVNIVVQMDPYDDCTGTFRYYITGVEQGSECPLYPEDIVQSLPEQDMTDPAALTDFINWAGDNYPADHYMLFIVDHGAGWKDLDILFKGILWDDTTGFGEYMDIPELAQSLDNANIVIDILDFDACLMQMIEVAWEIGKGMSFPPNYLIASEALGWTPVLSYDDFLAQLTGNPDIEQSVICETIVNGYINNLSPNTGTMSTLDLNSFLNNSLDIINNFANALINSMYQNEISNAQLTTQNYAYNYGYRCKDLFDFAERIKNNVSDCQNEAQAIMDLITNIIITEGHIGSDMENSHGLSIYLVDSPSEYDSDYDFLQFTTDSQWDEFLQYYTPNIVPPTVTTLPADSITKTSARLHGSVDSTGGEDPFAVVFEYRLKSGGLETVVKYGVGNYYADLTGLTPGNTYEFRFYAENSAGKGYGNWLEFTTDPNIVPPTVTTRYVDNITQTSARLHGSIDDTGGEEPFDAGFGYRLKSGGLETVVKYPVGNYYADITGLTPDTTYEFRFWAENSAGRTYGNYISWTTHTIVPPTVTTLNASNLTKTSAIVWISIDDTGGEDPFSAGVYWGLKEKLFYSESETESIGSNVRRIINITENNKIGEISETESPASADFYFGEEEKISSFTEKYGVGVYHVDLTGLNCNTTYQYRAYAENSAGEGTGDYKDFTTLACSVVPPTVSRGSLYDYSTTQVKAYGKIESTGGENPYKAGMYIKDLTTGGAAVGWYITGDFQAGDTYYIIIPNLISGHLYSRCAYAENSAGKGYSDWGNFTKP